MRLSANYLLLKHWVVLKSSVPTNRYIDSNKMTIEKVYYDGQVHDADENIDLELPVMKIMNLANDTKIAHDKSLIGDPY